jgi:hypothetical protein
LVLPSTPHTQGGYHARQEETRQEDRCQEGRQEDCQEEVGRSFLRRLPSGCRRIRLFRFRPLSALPAEPVSRATDTPPLPSNQPILIQDDVAKDRCSHPPRIPKEATMPAKKKPAKKTAAKKAVKKTAKKK